MNGPGWDSRFGLLDDEYALRKHDMTFTPDMVDDPASKMPNDTLYFLQEQD
jgi:hypothetical protein